MNNAYIAVDIGASSGRLIVGEIENQRLQLKEVHRFKNKMTFQDSHYHWDIDHLFNEIKQGVKNISESMEVTSKEGGAVDLEVVEKYYESIGIDTWAVDYVLVDDNGERVAPVYAYRDHRTDETMEKVFEIVDRKTIYHKTGIQFLQFNTIYQLFEHGNMTDDFKKATSLMMVPDYLHYLLSGVKSIEYTNATSTQLLNVLEKDWDTSLLESIGVDEELLSKPIEPGTVLGTLKDDVAQEVGMNELKVVAPATHDTGSAVVSVPAIDNNFAYISSGTWSLMGIESTEPITTEKASEFNFTNEGGVYGTYRVLKNIMGLWLIQEVARHYDGQYSFAEFVEMAEASEGFKSIIVPNDNRFLNPENMIEEIQGYCAETNQCVPKTPGEIARCIFESLALLYKDVLIQLKEISDQPIERIHIIGGGCQNKMLNQLCADFTGCEVYAGPIEATAIGNLAMQMIVSGEVKDLAQARQMIRDSFQIDIYEPSNNEKIDAHYNEFRRLKNEQ